MKWVYLLKSVFWHKTVLFLILLIFSLEGHSQTLDKCIEYSATGALTCATEPNILEPWWYMLPG